MTCETNGTLTICYGPPTKVVKTQQEPPRWCFGERKRQGGTWELHGYTEPSYYEPFWIYKCDGCGEDRRLFPGTIEEWADA